jgi:hypothetical protein
MKKLVLITTTLLLPFFVFAQTELPGALGLTFGMNKASVKRIMIDKGGVLDASNSDANTQVYTGVTMGIKHTDWVGCNFINDKLYSIKILFIPVTKLNTQGLFDDLQAIITTKYGKPESIRKFISPYSDGDGNEIDAVLTGKGTIVSLWIKFKNDSGISLEVKPINYQATILLLYEDGILMKEVNAKNANEF